MSTNLKTPAELISELQTAATEILQPLQSLSEEQYNKVPYKDSWTAGQLIEHVTLSIYAMAKAMQQPGQPAGRDADERSGEIKKIFLDFSSTMKSPDFIVPEERTYHKDAAAAGLNNAVKEMEQNAAGANLPELISGLPLGPITRLELLHFVVYHTQRHLHQMGKIIAAL